MDNATILIRIIFIVKLPFFLHILLLESPNVHFPTLRFFREKLCFIGTLIIKDPSIWKFILQPFFFLIMLKFGMNFFFLVLQTSKVYGFVFKLLSFKIILKFNILRPIYFFNLLLFIKHVCLIRIFFFYFYPNQCFKNRTRIDWFDWSDH